MLEQHHLARNHDPVLAVAGLVDQLLKQRVDDDVGVHEVPPATFPDVDGVKIVGDLVIGRRVVRGGGGGDGVDGGGACGAAEFGEGRKLLDG